MKTMTSLGSILGLGAVLLLAACVEDQDASCYSPDQNLDDAYDEGAVGCPCSSNDADVCKSDSQGKLVALVCSQGRWQAVEDGPCGL